MDFEGGEGGVDEGVHVEVLQYYRERSGGHIVTIVQRTKRWSNCYNSAENEAVVMGGALADEAAHCGGRHSNPD